MMEVPVPDLLQMTHPGYALVEPSRIISEKNIPVYIDFCRCVLSRFEHYGDMNITPPDLFKHLTKAFQTVFEDDDPEVFLPAKCLIPRLLEEFELTISNMELAFKKNPRIRFFYRHMGSQLRQCFEHHIQGDVI